MKKSNKAYGPTLAEVLHLAADECLLEDECPPTARNSEGPRRVVEPSVQAYASCLAVHSAAEVAVRRDPRIDYKSRLKVTREICHRIDIGMRRMGLDTGSVNFGEFYSGAPRQGARYAWLKFCALIAEERGA